MNLRSPLFACPMFALAVLSGCSTSTAYSNRQMCVAQVRTSYDEAGDLPFKITNVSVATRGSRVVVEGTVVAPPTHKSVLAVLAAAPEKLALAAQARVAGAPNQAASAALPASTPQPAGTTASAASAASAAEAPPAHKIPAGGAGAECLFDGRQLTHFQWLTPSQMAALNPLNRAAH